MAAYGALVSLSHLLHQILHPPPLFTNIIIIQTQQIQLLEAKIELLINFLEAYPSRRDQEYAELEARIRDAAYAAEDIIESNVVNQIHASDLYRRVELETSILSSQEEETSTISSLTKKISTLVSQKRKKPIQKEFPSQGIEGVLGKFNSIWKDLLKMRGVQGVGDVQLKSSAAAAARPPPPGGKSTMVGFDDHLLRIKSELATDESSRKVIPITGMGGIGKTTLASAVYNDLFIVEHFHVRAWVTISQEYDVEESIHRLLSEINKSINGKQESGNDEPGVQLHKKLSGRKYLIVMDDMWDIQAWDGVRRFLPDNGNGSRVLVTSRLSNMADDLGSCPPYKLDILDKGHSWDLFRKKIFGEEKCPVELEGIGKYIVDRCGGLPLALALISGLLSKSERAREQWEVFAGDMPSILNFGNAEQVTKILSLSYTHLPVYLKPCFLYTAMFPEDFNIGASTLIRLWVAEGLIKPTQDKCLEEIADEYLEDLVSRNVILVGGRGSLGKVESCKLHDLIRDLCIAQAEKEKFVWIAKLDNPNISPNLKIARRLSVYATGERPLGRTVNALQSASLNRSWLSLSLPEDNWYFKMRLALSTKGKEKRMVNGFKLLKVAYERDRSRLIELLNLSNLRYVSAHSIGPTIPMLLCWNLQTLVIHEHGVVLNIPPEIWLMPQLRHVKMFAFYLPDPPSDDKNVIVLENLQTIEGVKLFKCSEHVVKRIPNLKRLQVGSLFRQAVDFGLHNFAHFKKIESLDLAATDKYCLNDTGEKLWPTIALPISLKELRLSQCFIPWEDLSIVGSLPNLEVLKLEIFAAIGEEWNPIEGQFCRLRSLLIGVELKIWGAEDYHFPCLESLSIFYGGFEIPLSFSDILTLQEIDLFKVEDCTWTSAKQISKEREELGYEPLLLSRRPL